MRVLAPPGGGGELDRAGVDGVEDYKGQLKRNQGHPYHFSQYGLRKILWRWSRLRKRVRKNRRRRRVNFEISHAFLQLQLPSSPLRPRNSET